MKFAHAIPMIAACGILLLAAACGGRSSHPNKITTTGSNVQAIAVNSGPAGNYANGAFTSVTVCAPGSSTCQTVDGILVDTGSSGLRILSSALTVSLPPQKASDGNPVAECLPFVSGYTWGPVQTADIKISGETASSAPIQVMSDSDFPVPTACSNFGTSRNTLTALGANGLLGVGIFAQDCGGACVTTGPGNPGLYYECPAAGCVVVGESLTQQVPNPVALFAADNNGVILELPAVTAPAASINGSMVFGIGTQSNNALGGATVYAVDANGNFVTTFSHQPYSQSFLDSGSNGLYFLTSSITGISVCPDASFFYCPASTQTLSATNAAATGSPSGQVSFSVANADNLFSNNSSDSVFEDLAGPNSLAGFDWGLPFFYGRNVFTAIEGKTTPSGTGPFWAY
ncbi:MAG TPA: DUF3443 domain-containing protein [Candidatus Sulfotelmatobacter sp.]